MMAGATETTTNARNPVTIHVSLLVRLIFAPQLGHAVALVLICAPHSLHFVIAMSIPLLHVASRTIIRSPMEQMRMGFIPLLHGLQRREALEG